MAVLSDIRTGLPGSTDERDGGDGAVAFVFGDRQWHCRRKGDGSRCYAEIVGQGSATDEFLDRWRMPGERRRTCGRSGSVRRCTCRSPRRRSADALKKAGVTADELDHLSSRGSTPAR